MSQPSLAQCASCLKACSELGDEMSNRLSSAWRHVVLVVLCLSQAACLGTTTPQIQEFWGTPADANQKVRLLVHQVRCELSRAIYRLRHESTAAEHDFDFLDDWGVQVVLELSVDEKSVISPGASVISPLPDAITTFGPNAMVRSPERFGGSAGGSYSNEAIATDKTTLFYLVKNLDTAEFINSSCIGPRANADLFIESDLGIYDWLERSLDIQSFDKSSRLNIGNIDNVLSHDVKFEIVSTGNATPTWRLVRFASDNNTLFAASRDRYQELIITMGKANKVGGGLSDAGAASSLASQIRSALQGPARALRR